MYKGYKKFGNKKITIDGVTFDSQKECNRWFELKLLEKAKEISCLERQIPFTLIPAQYINGRCVERECKYVADFVYRDKRNNLVVEDTKSQATKTPEYRIKKKLLLREYGIQIQEV